MSETAVIYGFEGQALKEDEIAFFKEAKPWGYILFARNIETPEQVRRLTDSLRDLSGCGTLPILVDQEGGRVARFREPHWRKAPPASVFGEIYARNRKQGLEAVRLNSRLLADELYAAGLTINCLPMLDVRAGGSDDVVIGDRAYSDDPEAITELGRAAAEGLLEGGILPTIKHLPGHGRSLVDSHYSLPVVEAPVKELEKTDFVPFRALNHLPIAMTGHLIFTALDPQTPSTLSKVIVEEVIRSDAEGRIGFDGLLLTDDISMEAIGGTYEERAQKALDAGCDIVLHCNGKMPEMMALASEIPVLAGKSAKRAQKALRSLVKPDNFDAQEGAESVTKVRYGKSK